MMSEHLKILSQKDIDEKTAALWRFIDKPPAYLDFTVESEHKQAVMELRHHTVAASNQLTAANARIAEYEAAACETNALLTQYVNRIAELEQFIELQHSRMKLIEDKFHEKAATNARLRELLRECEPFLDNCELTVRVNNELREDGR